MKLEEVASHLGLYNQDLTIDAKVDNVLIYMVEVIKPNFPEWSVLKEQNTISPELAEKIVRMAAKSRGEEHSADIDALTKSLRDDIELMNDNRFPYSYFGTSTTARYSGQDILDTEILPHSCTSYAILTYDLLKVAGIKSEVWWMTKEGRKGGHAVVRYQREDGSWQRCDPKWQKRVDDDGIPIFFRYNPELLSEFREERIPLLHGGKVISDAISEKRIQLEYEKQVQIR